jgi:hypothetical protein
MRCGCWTWSAAPGAWTPRTGGAAPRSCMQRAAARYVGGCPSASTSERRAREQDATGARASRAARQGEDRQRRRSTARRGYIRGRGRSCRGGGGGERRRRWPEVVASAATVPGPLPAGEVVGSSGLLDVCVRRYDVVGRRRQRAQLPNSQLPPCTAGGGPARHAIHRRRCRCRHAWRHRAHPTTAAASPGWSPDGRSRALPMPTAPRRRQGRWHGDGGRGGNGGWDGSDH